jgi:hypothetical protein
VADFEGYHELAFADSYDWGLWGAACVINGGCSDDCFDYFRAYLISRGREVFEAAVADPDSLASVEIDDEESWEDWMSPSMYAVEARTGEYAYVAPERHPRRRRSPWARSGTTTTSTSASRASPRSTAASETRRV